MGYWWFSDWPPYDAMVILDSTTLSANTAAIGSGVYIEGDRSPVEIRNTIIEGGLSGAAIEQMIGMNPDECPDLICSVGPDGKFTDQTPGY